MTGTVLTARFDSAPIARHLARLAILDARRFDGARREIGELMLGDIQDNLDGQRLVDGSGMPQSRAAIARKGKTLIDSHRLYDSYVYQLVGANVEVGSALIYAAIHHWGGETGRFGHRFHMEARPVMGMTADLERRIGDVLVADIEAAQR